ncbi:tetratricopeptide repeat protein [Methanocaldococcus indicus]|uniref:tetratricopeptide repeat protein n=1 Tax=Methanocaldococcus indicus TaxID=213231 RepID=UPI003C6D2C2A
MEAEKLKLLLEAITLAEKNKIEEAIDYLDEILKKDEANKYAIFLKGLCYECLGKLKESITEYEKLNLIYNKQNAIILNKLMNLYFVYGDFDNCIECINNFSKILGETITTQLLEAIIYVEIGEYDKALKVLDKILKKDDKHAHALRLKATLLHSFGKVEEAIKIIDKLLEIDKDDGYAWYLKGKWLKEIGNFEEALKCLYVAMELKKDLFHVHKDLGHLELIIGDVKEAINHLEEYLKKYPNDLEAILYLAMAYEKAKKYEKALELYNKIISTKEKHMNYTVYLAMLHKAGVLERLGKYEEALDIYNQLFEADNHGESENKQ